MIRHLEWLTAMEAAAYLKVKVRTLLLWARQGKVKGFALSGTKRRIRKSEARVSAERLPSRSHQDMGGSYKVGPK
jgi:excisionase family DNA binding protein